MNAIGAGLVLIALGAIFKFAVTAELSWLRLDVMGVVLMLVGAAWLLLGLVIYQNRRRGTVVTRRIWEEHGEPEEEIIEERRTYDEPPA
jgi:predicted membrane channel-forming protein YqfA (hemolysin III family)